MTFYLLDGTALCYRAYYAYATRHLRNSKGFPTSVPYGFLLYLRKILNDFNPDGIIATFDLEGGTFRHEEYEDYKANRDETPEDLIVQFPLVRKLLEAYRIPIVEKKGFEADDMMGTLAKEIAAQGHSVVLVTSDKDACQLVNGKIKIMDPGKDYKILGNKEVVDKLGVKPSQVPDLFGLMGDSSDNIPGVPGIGPKTAKELISKFASLEGVYKNIHEIKGEAKKRSLLENKDNAFLSRKLAVIKCDVSHPFKIEDSGIQTPNYQALTDIFKELEFRSFLKEIPQDEVSSSSKKYTLVCSESEWSKVLTKLKKAKAIAFDFETTGTDALLAKPVGISFSIKANEAYFVLFDLHVSNKSTLSAEKVLNDIKGIMEDDSIKKYGQNIKYELMILRQYGIELRGISFDTMVASYLLNPSKRNHNLNDLALEFLNERLTSIESLIGTGRKQITMAEVDLEKLYLYGCQDSDVVWRLTEDLSKRIKKTGLSDLMSEVEMPLITVLSEMECNGIGIDVDFLNNLSSEMHTQIKGYEKKIYKLAGEEFNIKSPKQLGEILFEKLELPVIRKTKTGYSTDVDVLNQLSEFHELPKVILHFRELSKLKSTYVDPMPELLNPNTKRIHTSFNQTVAATGRLSSSHPNLQNIPVRTEEGRKIREGFVADKDKLLLAADYSQIELRVLAHLSKDPQLQKAFKNNQDVHAYTASLIFSTPQDEVTAEMRDQAKTVNFGVLYGMGPFSLSRSLNISQEAAKDFIQAYFDRYPKVKAFMDDTIVFAKKNGYVETLFKRRRYIPDIKSREMRVRQFAERTAINAPVQGTASDLIKIAMINIHPKLLNLQSLPKMLLQVHDELVFEVDEKHVEAVSELVKDEMEKAIVLDIPIEVTLKSGKNWKSLKAMDI